MKKLFSIFAALLFAGSIMASVGNLYYTATFLKGTTEQGNNISGYAATGDYTTNGLTWTIPGNNTNGDYIRIGGKQITSVERVIAAQNAMGDAIAKIVISHNGISRNDVVVDSVMLTVASNAAFTTGVVKQVYKPASPIAKSTPGTIEFTTDDKWATGSYYKFSFYITNASTSNGGLDVQKIEFYSYIDASAPSITASNIDLGLCLTKDGAYTKTVDLEVVGANLTDAITYTIDGYNTTATGTLTKDGGTLQVTFSSNDATGDHVNTITLSSGTTTIDVTVTASVLIVSGFGTKTDPFSVADVVAINNRLPGTEKYWVLGYIVGSAANGGALADTDVATNFALGDAVDQTTNLVPVELPSGAIRTALNIVDNTDNKGKLVKVYGQLISYFTFTGVKGTSDYEFITVVEPTYYLKNNWEGGDDWVWKEMAKVNDDQYKLENVVFGGNGVNFNTEEVDETATWVALADFQGDNIKALDTVTLILTPSTGAIYAQLVGEYIDPVVHTYTVAGDSEAAFGTTWTPANTDNDMVEQGDGTFLWEKENVTLAAGSIAFKVCEDHAWTVAYPSDNYSLAIPEAGVYTISISFDPASHEITAIATKTGSAVVIPTIALHGNFTGSWTDTELFTLAANEETASLTLALTAGNYEFGMRIGGSGNWTSNGAAFTRENPSAVVVAGSGNLTLAADVAGDYVFTWTYETNTLSVEFPVIPEYNIWVTGSAYGYILSDKTSAAEGETVTITITPDDNYELDELTVTGLDASDITINGNTATFIMPGHEVTISATFKEVAAATKYCEFPTGHLSNPDFGDPNGRILLTIQKIEGSNNLRVAVKNNNANGNTKTGLNFLWVNATNATNNNATYGSHDAEDVEEVSVIVEFDAAQDSYNFVNIHWAYSGWGGEWAIDGLTVLASELCEAGPVVAIDNTELKVKAVKTIENGMLIIEHNGVRYNAQGQVVR